MSVRAHRVLKIKSAGESFNLWHDKEVCEWLQDKTDFFERLNIDSCGLSEVSVENLEKMLNTPTLSIDNDTINTIRHDIEEVKRQGEEYIQYYCY